MKKITLVLSAIALAQCTLKTNPLAKKILADNRLDSVRMMANELIATGFNAGTSYGEVWIRDYNTFINSSLEVLPKEKGKRNLLMFFKFQGSNGNIVDGFIPKENATGGYNYISSDLAPNFLAHKNTVETDQETSLIQAVKKYIVKTGDTTILDEDIGGKTVLERMEWAIEYLMAERWSQQHGLIIGATTVDWGDVQPEAGWGVSINKYSKWAIDIYDNAMLVIALNDLLAIYPHKKDKSRWVEMRKMLKENIRKHLWDKQRQKYIPHLYLNGSPFPKDFDENEILYFGGTACAVLAGLHNTEEVVAINKQMVEAAQKEGTTIGMTSSPPYPSAIYPNMKAYSYQNGGDWTWFGARMIEGLIHHDLIQEAYEELIPMLDRVLTNRGFMEWYEAKTGKPKGSGKFRGSAGVLVTAIDLLREWAKKNEYAKN